MPPRRKKAKVVASDATTEVATSSGANAETKAHAPTRRNLRGRRGSLKDMLNMPLDVLFEVRILLKRPLLHRNLTAVNSIPADFRPHASARLAQPGTDVEGLPHAPHEPRLCAILEGGKRTSARPAGMPYVPERAAVRQPAVLFVL